jgi:hypothetical protein
MEPARVALVVSGGLGRPGLGGLGGASPAPTSTSSIAGEKFPRIHRMIRRLLARFGLPREWVLAAPSQIGAAPGGGRGCKMQSASTAK